MKYKLIKTYPGSPELGTIKKVPNNFRADNDELYYQITNYPEFWQLVVEKDYEILSLISNKNYNALFKNDKVYYYPNNLTFKGISKDSKPIEFSLKNFEENKSNSHWSIYSVKRLSDGEIFTVEDSVLSKTCSVPNKILSIELIDGKIRLYPRNSFYHLNDIKKVKQPLFKTEDDVDIFEGDKYYTAYDENYKEDYWKWKIYFVQLKEPSLNLLNKSIHRFSTKEKAEEYILLNKPCLSLNDYYLLFDDYIRDNGIGQKLQDLVKQKLK